MTFNPERKWTYVEPAGAGAEDPNAPVYTTMTEQQIIDQFYDHWAKQMLKVALTKVVEISHEQCIADWVVVHWAWEGENRGKE